MDLNKDGEVDAEEFYAVWQYALETQKGLRWLFDRPYDELFTAIDTDRDGYISLPEMATWIGQIPVPNGLPCPDPEGDARRIFAAIDMDASQRIDRLEFESAYERIVRPTPARPPDVSEPVQPVAAERAAPTQPAGVPTAAGTSAPVHPDKPLPKAGPPPPDSGRVKWTYELQDVPPGYEAQ